MRKKGITLTVLVVVLTLGVVTSIRSQNAPPKPSDATNAKRSLAIGLLRAINTAELDYKIKYGLYANWEALSTSGGFLEKGLTWAAKNDPQFAEVKLSKAPEVLPGWTLRLNLTADAQHYDLMLQDKEDECVYAAVTNESGLIWQAKNIQCPL
jgi:hypothetical protein